MSAKTPTADLGARILVQLAGHDSKRPARADDIAALIGGDEPAYWAAVERLKATSQINCAHIKRGADPEPWLAIWPTGLPARNNTWKALNARGCFAVHHIETPRRLPQSPAQRRAYEDNAMKRNPNPAAPDRRERIAELVRGRALAQGLLLADIAPELGISVEGVRYLVKGMLGGLRVARGRLPGEHADRLFDPAVSVAGVVSAPAAAASRQGTHDNSAEPPAPAPAAPPVTPIDPVCAGLAAIADALGDMEPDDGIDLTAAAAQVPNAPRARISYALWDDGGLSIYDGDELIQLPPADVARLARLLGVPCCQLASGVPA